MTTDEKNEPEIHTLETPAKVRREPQGLGAWAFLALAACAVALGYAIHSGLRVRAAANVTLKEATEQAAVLSVNVVKPQLASPIQEIVLPGNTQAFTDTPIYARTNGYLKRWYFDIGAHVRQGELLAEIETPEVDQQLQQARSQLATAEANYDLAKTTAARWQFLLQTDSVSKQETDQAVSNLNAQKATVASNAANVRRLEQLQAFEKVYAPFDGVITARNIDVGALITAGSGGTARELFHLTAIQTLRVYVAVPEVYSRAAQPGATATLTLEEFPGRIFHGTLVRHSNAIDPASRTLLVEVDVDNPEGQLKPGSYVSVHLRLPKQIHSFTIPANTLLFRSEGLRAALVRNDRAELVPISIGHDYGAAVEVVSGIQPDDWVIVDPADSLVSGTPVRVNRVMEAPKP